MFTSLPILTGIHVCFSFRMITRVALAPPVAVSQTAPRPWPSPAASNKLPPATQTCPQVSDALGPVRLFHLPAQRMTTRTGRAWEGRFWPQSETQALFRQGFRNSSVTKACLNTVFFLFTVKQAVPASRSSNVSYFIQHIAVTLRNPKWCDVTRHKRSESQAMEAAWDRRCFPSGSAMKS